MLRICGCQAQGPQGPHCWGLVQLASARACAAELATRHAYPVCCRLPALQPKKAKKAAAGGPAKKPEAAKEPAKKKKKEKAAAAAAEPTPDPRA